MTQVTFYDVEPFFTKGLCPPWQPFFKIACKISDNAENLRFTFDKNSVNVRDIIVYCFKNVQAMKLQINNLQLRRNYSFRTNLHQIEFERH